MIDWALDRDARLLPVPLPSATPDEIVGLLKILSRIAHGGRIAVAELAETVAYDDDKLLSLLDLLQILGFSDMKDGSVRLSPVGRRYARARDPIRRIVFRDQLVRRLPLVRYLVRELKAGPGAAPTLGELRDRLHRARPDEELADALAQVVAWGRYAALFDFDRESGRLSLRREAAPPDE